MLRVIKNNQNIALDIGNVTIEAVDSVNPLGITIDPKLKFNLLVAELCQKANKKISSI